ncbi:type I-Fv CRISPR-associated protein Cas5fv [Photobacterium kishitanii]|uniref:Cas5fv helical domain-containing protein n=1 Tax=Photobacterium kishitanii TaxID=318456 RepID=A0A2T3KLY6_9GAMM|nr:type I-Fv CRISPR-associated protein Cas5fv [Photobacterium kishitanii]PSV00693.1 hypothetical protein C9J27_06010 [Photobacterium kishitanii]
MLITVDYESSYRNSFLDGSNNEPIPKKGRSFCASSKSLNDTKKVNYKKREITIDTVMGVLNRLIGDQRKLFQSRESRDYYFADLERDSKISFDDKPTRINDELIYLRNISGSTDPSGYSGVINDTLPLITAPFARELWETIMVSPDELCHRITTNFAGTYEAVEFEMHPMAIFDRMSGSLQKYKPLPYTGVFKAAHDILQEAIPKFNALMVKETKTKSETLIKTTPLYCSALYFKLIELESRGIDISVVTEKSGAIKGFSKNSVTPKDFIAKFSHEKKVWGNPYLMETRTKGEGRMRHSLTVASGSLDIIIDVPEERAIEIKSMIEDARLSTFYLGKKGSAYVSKISTRSQQ